MSVHDWSRVDQGIFHDFHQSWTIELRNALNRETLPKGSVALIEFDQSNQYASKANRISIQHPLGRVVAVVEIVSPGNKSSVHAVRTFVEKARELLMDGINLLVVDLFPPTVRDPQGIHKEIWDQISEEPFALPSDKPLTIAAYSAGEPKQAYVEPICVGDPLPPLPIFLSESTYIPAPLEASYQTTWDKCPQPVRELVLGENV